VMGIGAAEVRMSRRGGKDVVLSRPLHPTTVQLRVNAWPFFLFV
jgi:hypothetical protein